MRNPKEHPAALGLTPFTTGVLCKPLLAVSQFPVESKKPDSKFEEVHRLQIASIAQTRCNMEEDLFDSVHWQQDEPSSQAPPTSQDKKPDVVEVSATIEDDQPPVASTSTSRPEWAPGVNQEVELHKEGLIQVSYSTLHEGIRLIFHKA